jgi:two-component system, sensor histidine kinase RegB
MPALDLAQDHPRRNVRLDTLVRLRWLAVIGQTTAVLVVYTGLDFELPVYACLAVIALSAWLNVALRLRFHMTQRLATAPPGCWPSTSRSLRCCCS